jgi:uncharacterized membrane protein
MKNSVSLVLISIFVLCLAATAQTTARCEFKNFDVPNSTFTTVTGINNSGVLAGTFGDSAGNAHGFIFRSHTFTTFNFPGASRTETGQINNRDWVVGDYEDAKTFVQKGYLLRSGTFTTIFVPGSSSTRASGINDRGVIVGTFDNSSGEHGFARIHGEFVTIDFPGASRTSARGINDAGEIVGIYGDQHGGNHGFILRHGHFTSLDFPGTSGTTGAVGISPTGIVVGNYFSGPLGGNGHGFIVNKDYDADDFETADFPGATTTTIGFDMNARQVMVGTYVKGFGSNHGFVADCHVLPRR